MKYPEMTVEKRDSKTAHGLKPPIRPGEPGWDEQLEDTMILARAANKKSWDVQTFKILRKWFPSDIENITDLELIQWMSSFGFNSWRSVVDFVGDDECVELLVRISKVLKNLKTPIRKDRDFIDGESIGLYDRYHGRLKPAMEKGADAKYYYKQDRPYPILNELLGFDSFFMFGYYMHPGHYSYPAWHGVKFFETLDLVRDSWDLSPDLDLMIHFVCYVSAMGRSGGFVHMIQDNIASAGLCGIPEYKFVMES